MGKRVKKKDFFDSPWVLVIAYLLLIFFFRFSYFENIFIYFIAFFLFILLTAIWIADQNNKFHLSKLNSKLITMSKIKVEKNDLFFNPFVLVGVLIIFVFFLNFSDFNSIFTSNNILCDPKTGIWRVPYWPHQVESKTLWGEGLFEWKELTEFSEFSEAFKGKNNPSYNCWTKKPEPSVPSNKPFLDNFKFETFEQWKKKLGVSEGSLRPLETPSKYSPDHRVAGKNYMFHWEYSKDEFGVVKRKACASIFKKIF